MTVDEQQVAAELPPSAEASRALAPYARRGAMRSVGHTTTGSVGRFGDTDVASLALELGQEPPVEAAQWWRRALRMGPDAWALREAELKSTLATPFDRCLTIAVANPKGSAGKTPTTRGIAAAFADARGGGVVAVCNNELRGTLGLRSTARHSGNIGDLLRASAWFQRAEASAIELERTMNRQPDSHEFVLGSDPVQYAPLSGDDFLTIHKILERFCDVIVLDMGNNELSENWTAAVSVADLLVVPMKYRRDHIVTAAAMLDGMAKRGDQIQGRTVIVGTNGAGDSVARDRAHAEEYFADFPRVDIPTDPALAQPTIMWRQLARGTRRAYQELGAQLCDLATATPE